MVTSLVVGVLVASLTVAPPAVAAVQGDDPVVDADREPGQVDPVPVAPVEGDTTPLPEHQDAVVWTPGSATASWPESGTAEVSVDGKEAEAGSLKIAAASPKSAGADAPKKLAVRTLGKKASDKLGVSGPLVTVEPKVARASATGVAPVELSVDYGAFARTYGGSWASRLQLVELPACAAVNPGKAKCRTPKKIDAVNDVGENTLSATIDTQESESTVFAVMADDDSAGGDYKATDLAASGEWTAGSGSGGFEYSYPVRVPPATGPVPQVGLAYSSQSVDGRTAGKNAQASWVGEGWNYNPGFIERSYETCLDDRSAVDGQDPNNADNKTGDLCWRGQNATISLNGSAGTIVRDDDTGEWRIESDANWRVERLTDSSLNGYDNNGEYWKVTTPDGTRHYFGKTPDASKSTWTAPVFGNHPGEPCHASAFENSSCKQAWRWNLDTVIDASGNKTRYYYSRETGHYGRAGDENDRVSYIRGGNITRIKYGLHTGEPGVAATAKIEFATADRCLVSGCRDSNGDPVEDKWGDTPWDRDCKAEPCTEQMSPTFYTARRMKKITTYARTGSSFTAGDKVESWTLNHEFLASDILDEPVLWLKSITHRAHNGGSTITDPSTRFTAVGMDNRVDPLRYSHAMYRFRIQTIRSESGADIQVTYSGADCVPDENMPASPSNNRKRCYPVYWQPEGQAEPVIDYFHKYVVTEVVQIDRTGGSHPIRTRYSYSSSGGGTGQLWAYDNNEMTKRKHRTYGQWRGYSLVKTRVGDGDSSKQASLTSATRFYRGMNGQPLPGGGSRSVSITDSAGDTVVDHRALAGRSREKITYEDGSTVASATTFKYWKRETARHGYSGGSQRAYLSGVSEERTRERLTSTAWRQTRVATTYNDEGYPTRVNDVGDTSDNSDNLCTRTTYVGNSSKWLRGLPARQETVSKACSATPSRPDDVVSDTKTFYDGATSISATPTKGRVTRTAEVEDWTDGSADYVTTARHSYDALGRVIESRDAKNRATTTDYTPSGAGPVTKTVTTNPAGHTSTTNLDPAYGQPTSEVDANGKRTDLAYDAAGRLTKAWLPGRAKGSESPHMRFGYVVRDDGPLVVTTETLAPNENYVTAKKLLDSLYRERQTQSEATGGGRLISTTHYNERGQVAATSGPNYATGDPGSSISAIDDEDDRARTIFTYDTLGRKTVEVFRSRRVEQWRTTTAYGGSPDGWRVATTPPEGDTPTVTLTDVRGNTTELRQYHGETPSGDHDATRYGYTPRGDLKTLTTADGRVARYGYDLRGRQVRNEDPDKGTSTTVYDATGQVIETTDARGEVVSTTFDALDRPTSRWEGQPETGTKLAEWAYDTLAKGQLDKTTSYVDGAAFVDEVKRYGDRYQVQKAWQTIPVGVGLDGVAGTYELGASHHDDGSVHRMSLPGMGGLDREITGRVYDDWGNLVRMGGSAPGRTTTYLDAVTYSPFGEVAQRVHGIDTKPQIFQTYLYEEGTRRLSEFYFDRDGTTVPNVAALSWTYDDAGNVTSIANNPENQSARAETQCFEHDYLRRMTEAWSQSAGSCAGSPSQSVVGGVAPYWHSYGFNLAGSRTSLIEHHASGDVTTSYAYDTAGKPSAVSTVTRGGDGASADDYTWDEAGNLVSRTVDGQQQSLTWSAQGKPTEIETPDGTARMFYNASGDRIARIDADGGVTAWIHGQELHKPADGGAAEATRYYSHGGDVFATRTNDGDLQWLASDHHDSVDYAINAEGLDHSVKYRDPYGNLRDHEHPNYWPQGSKGFVGGTEDPTGLIQLGARPYDPTLGMFLAVDPLGSPTDPQKFHPYTYGANSPATFSDPDGLRPWCGPSCVSPPAPETEAGKGAVTNASNNGTTKPPRPGPAPKREPWERDLARNKADMLDMYGYDSWNEMVRPYEGPMPGVVQPLTDHAREEMFMVLQDRTCEQHPDHCYEIGNALLSGAVIWASARPGGPAAPREKYKAARAVQRAVDHVQSTYSVDDTLRNGLTNRQWRFLRRTGSPRWLQRVMYGTALQKLAHERLLEVHGRGSWENRSRGVDYRMNKNRATVELTTRGQRVPHINRGGEYPRSPMVTYNIHAALGGFNK